MQKYALNSEGQLTYISLACKRRTYLCPSCRSPMRVRSGPFRIAHYYHLTKACAISAPTSAQHREVQKRILQFLAPEGAIMEKFFPTIRRTADIALPAKGLIFEVQCSPISKKEVKQRNAEYGSLGFQVVWILHDQTFNRTFLSSAERFILSRPHYYTNIDQEGKGIIYDQFSIYQGNQMIYKGKSLPILLNQSLPPPFIKKQRGELGHQINLRKKRWQISFGGDLLHKAESREVQQGNRPRTLTRRFAPYKKNLLHFFRKLYNMLLDPLFPTSQFCAKGRHQKRSKSRGHFL